MDSRKCFQAFGNVLDLVKRFAIENGSIFYRYHQNQKICSSKLFPEFFIDFNVLMLLRQQLRDGKGELELSLEEAFPPSLVDPDRMKQVLVNLLMNALVAIPSGGRIRIGTRSLDGAVELEVANSGPPIPAGIRESLFTPFITTRQEGTGLGLAVVHQIVVEHGGSIDVASEPPWGTVFRIRLPLPATESTGSE